MSPLLRSRVQRVVLPCPSRHRQGYHQHCLCLRDNKTILQTCVQAFVSKPARKDLQPYIAIMMCSCRSLQNIHPSENHTRHYLSPRAPKFKVEHNARLCLFYTPIPISTTFKSMFGARARGAEQSQCMLSKRESNLQTQSGANTLTSLFQRHCCTLFRFGNITCTVDNVSWTGACVS